MRLNTPFLLNEDETKHMLKETNKYNPGYRHEFHESAFPMNMPHLPFSQLFPYCFSQAYYTQSCSWFEFNTSAIM